MRTLATLTLATLTAATLLFASPAAAIQGNTWIQCPDGATSTGHMSIDDVGRYGYLRISGHGEPCSAPRYTDVYTVAAYYPYHAEAVAATNWGDDLYWYSHYSSSDGRFQFEAEVWVHPDATAICLVTSSQARTHCYELTTASSSSTPTVGAAIPTTDSRVQHEVALPGSEPPDPTRPPSCGACW